MQYKEAAQMCASVFQEKEALYGNFISQYNLRKIVARLKNKLILAQNALNIDVGEPIQTIYIDIYNYALMGTFFTCGNYWSVDTERSNLAVLFEVRNKAYNSAWVKMPIKDVLDSIFVKIDRIESLIHQAYGSELLDSFRDVCNYAIFNIIKSNEKQPFKIEKRLIYGREMNVLALNMSIEKSGGVLQMYTNAINKCKATLSVFLPQHSENEIDVLIVDILRNKEQDYDLQSLYLDSKGEFWANYTSNNMLKIIYEK